MNLVVLVLDTLRYDCVHHTPAPGIAKVETPHLDALRRDGVSFSAAFGEAEPTIPVRRALWTGLRSFPWRFSFDTKGLWPNPRGWHKIPPEQATFSELLLDAQYKTCLIGDVYHIFKPTQNFTRGFFNFDFVRGQETDNWKGGSIELIREEAERSTRNFDNNTTACANVTAACRALRILKVVYASSVTVYDLGWQARNGGVTRLPANESVPHRPSNAYSLSKWVGEELFTLAGKEFGLHTASLRPSLVIGPDEYPTRGRPRDDTAAGGLWGHVDSRDVAQAARLAAEKLGTVDELGPGNHSFNVNAAVAHARRPLAELIPQHFPNLSGIAESLEGHATAFGIEKARRLLGYAPKHSWRTELGE